jgi:hypothetical protein
MFRDFKPIPKKILDEGREEVVAQVVAVGDGTLRLRINNQPDVSVQPACILSIALRRANGKVKVIAEAGSIPSSDALWVRKKHATTVPISL